MWLPQNDMSDALKMSQGPLSWNSAHAQSYKEFKYVNYPK